MKSKAIEWVKRYLPAEIFATIGAILGSLIVFYFTGNRILAAYVGTIGENTGFYGFIFLRENIQDIKKSRKKKKKHGVMGFFKTIRNLVVEFGFSEFLDSFIVRPFCMWIFPIIIGNYALGIIAGKIAADVVFYVPTIIAYELRKKHLN